MCKIYSTVVLAICTVITVSLAAYLFWEGKEAPVKRNGEPGKGDTHLSVRNAGELGEVVDSDQTVQKEDGSVDDLAAPPDGVPDLPKTKKSDGLPEGSLSDWNLILLGPHEENKIDEELDLELTQFDTQRVDSRAADAYATMRDAAAAEGITLYLRSGYRSMETQRQNYNGSVQRYLDAGKSREEALRLTNEYYTVPGHSEHHTGLAFDIITPEYHNQIYSLDDRFADTDAYTWLRENCARYGFILRYPKEKEEETQINFEPWHYRYVGKEHAQYIMEHGLCLEEYIALLKEAGR